MKWHQEQKPWVKTSLAPGSKVVTDYLEKAGLDTYLNVNSNIPMVGASGAISGVLGAYMVRYPRNKVLVLIPFGFFTQMVRIPAMFVLGFWFILQFISSSGSSGQGGVAYGAHIGGFVFGAVVMFFFGNFLIPQKPFFKALNEKDGKKKNPWIQD